MALKPRALATRPAQALAPKPAAVEVLPFERQPCDTDESFAAFCRFRDQALPRQLAGVANVAPHYVRQWHSGNAWAARVAAFDSYMDAVRIEEREAIVRETSREISIKPMALLKTAGEIAQKELLKTLRASELSGSSGVLKPNELVRLMEITIKYDRLVRGETTENIATDVSLDGLSEDQIDLLLTLDPSYANGES